MPAEPVRYPDGVCAPGLWRFLVTYDSDEGLRILGRAIELMREEKGVSVDELADASGVPGKRIAALEAGQHDPTYELLIEIADGLDMPTAAIIVRAEQLSPSG